MRLKSLLFFTLLFSVSIHVCAQQIEEHVFNEKIKTVRLHRKGWELSKPIILLQSNEQLTLSFDELSGDAKTYSYSIFHCSANWTPSEIAQTEYLRGFTSSQIDDYNFSFNTTFEYVHYTVNFPNDDIQLMLSGNYVIKVFEDYNENEPILIKRFMVTEQVIQIKPEIRFPINSVFRGSMQQVNIRILHPHLDLTNPSKEITMVVQQNGRMDNLSADQKPDFVRPGELAYEYNKELLFDGGNEFRWLDIRSTRFLPEHVKSMQMHHPYYHAELFADKSRYKVPYFYRDDSNGKYVISVREYNDPTIEADYIFVHFTMPMEAPILDGDVYIGGELTNWNIKSQNRMTYNFETMQYEKILLLKQGFYNYHYWFVPKHTQKADIDYLEGNNSIAENDYHIYVYFRGPSEYYDRLIGTQTVNSLKPSPIK